MYEDGTAYLWLQKVAGIGTQEQGRLGKLLREVFDIPRNCIFVDSRLASLGQSDQGRVEELSQLCLSFRVRDSVREGIGQPQL
jgi:hypothetical protein